MNCFRCGGRSMLVYCTIYHYNYCFDVNQKKNCESNQFGAIITNKRDKDGKTIYRYGIMSCYHHEHHQSYVGDGNITDLPSVTPA